MIEAIIALSIISAIGYYTFAPAQRDARANEAAAEEIRQATRDQLQRDHGLRI